MKIIAIKIPSPTIANKIHFVLSEDVTTGSGFETLTTLCSSAIGSGFETSKTGSGGASILSGGGVAGTSTSMYFIIGGGGGGGT